jgi:hypothetical protein
MNKSYSSQFVFDVSNYVDTYGGYHMYVDYVASSPLPAGTKIVVMVELLSQ